MRLTIGAERGGLTRRPRFDLVKTDVFAGVALVNGIFRVRLYGGLRTARQTDLWHAFAERA